VLHVIVEGEVQSGEGGREEAADGCSKDPCGVAHAQIQELGGLGKNLSVSWPRGIRTGEENRVRIEV
jgi:hypothetical protein